MQDICCEVEEEEQRPVVISSLEVQRLLDAHAAACGCEAGCKSGCNRVVSSPAGSACEPESLPLPLPLPPPMQRSTSGSSAATEDLPEAADAASKVVDQAPSALPLPVPPSPAQLPLPLPLPDSSAAPKTAPQPPPSPLSSGRRAVATTETARTAMIPCAVEASMCQLPGLLGGGSVGEAICGSPSCPLSRYGTHTHKSASQLPPVGSAERQYLEEYVNRCFSNMTLSLGQTLVPCA